MPSRTDIFEKVREALVDALSVEEGLACLCGDGQSGRDRALRLGELAGGLLRFGEDQHDAGRGGLVPRLGGEGDAFHDLGERAGIAGQDAGCGV